MSIELIVVLTIFALLAALNVVIVVKYKKKMKLTFENFANEYSDRFFDILTGVVTILSVNKDKFESEEAYEKAKMSGEMYLTGQGAFLYTKLFVNEMITQKGLISSDMLDDDQVEQYLAWAADLGITYNIEIKEGVVCED